MSGHTYYPSDLNAIWARRFALPARLKEIVPEYREFAKREYSVVMDAFLESHSIFQMNGYMADRLAGNRLVQSIRAKQVGLAVPEMCVTQNQQSAARFVNLNEDCISKALSYGRLTSTSNKTELVAFSSRTSAETNFEDVNCCPTLLQQRIPGRFEWRITTVGERVFSARTVVPPGKVDWRLHNDECRFETAEPPDEVKHHLLKLCSVSNLSYGAHDLIESRDGTFYFLETNPAGQWGWLELSLGMPISSAIADELARTRPRGQND